MPERVSAPSRVKSKPKETANGFVPVSTWLHRDQFAQLSDIAERNDRSVAAEVRRAVRIYLEDAA